MSRRENSGDGSLELLLDTICNTFGGVLFISILVVIMLNMSSKEAATTPPSQEAREELQRLRKQLADTNAVLKTEELADQIQQEHFEQLDDPDILRAAQQLQQSQQRRVELTEKRGKDLETVSQSQIEANGKLEQLEEIKNAKKKLDDIKRQMEREVEERQRELELPKMRKTEKEQVAFFLRNGRLCAFKKLDRNGNLARNDAEAVVRFDGRVRYVEPKPGAGLAVDLQGGNTEEIDQRFAVFDSKKYYIAIIVWPDSYKHFAVVKDRMVSNEYGYHLMPLAEGGRVYLGGGGGGREQ